MHASMMAEQHHNNATAAVDAEPRLTASLKNGQCTSSAPTTPPPYIALPLFKFYTATDTNNHEDKMRTKSPSPLSNNDSTMNSLPPPEEAILIVSRESGKIIDIIRDASPVSTNKSSPRLSVPSSLASQCKYVDFKSALIMPGPIGVYAGSCWKLLSLGPFRRIPPRSSQLMPQQI